MCINKYICNKYICNKYIHISLHKNIMTTTATTAHSKIIFHGDIGVSSISVMHKLCTYTY